MKSNDSEGFAAIHDFVVDALINPTAYAKVYVEQEDRVHTRCQKGLLPPDLATLMSG